MPKYLILYHSDAALTGPSVAEMMARATPEQMAAGMAVWNAWREKTGSAMVDLGSPLVKSAVVADGKTTNGKSAITGYSVLQAASLDEAVGLVKDHPHFRTPGGASVQILDANAGHVSPDERGSICGIDRV